jgi:hypothetical protein
MDIVHEIEAALCRMYKPRFPDLASISGSDRAAMVPATQYIVFTVQSSGSKTPRGTVGMATVDMCLFSNLDQTNQTQRTALWNNLKAYLAELPRTLIFKRASSRLHIHDLIVDDESDASDGQQVCDMVKFRVPYNF